MVHDVEAEFRRRENSVEAIRAAPSFRLRRGSDNIVVQFRSSG
jgi:hypothetical protein